MNRLILSSSLCLLTTAVVSNVAEAAGTSIEDYFDAPKSCYSRSYSDKHMAGHPQQKVDDILINHATGPQEAAWLGDITPAKPVRVMRIRLHVKGQDQHWEEFAGCELSGNKIECSMECDAGQFSIKMRPDGKILLNADSELWFTDCDAGDQVMNPEPDDKSFLLSAKPLDTCLPPDYQ